MSYVLVEVDRFPTVLLPGTLYFSREFKMCAHQCACGCGDVIQLPVDDQNYRLTVDPAGVTVRPSIGNWNVCDAHYYITRGRVEWMPRWSASQIQAARDAEDARRNAHYRRKSGWKGRVRSWLGRLKAWFGK